MSPRTKIALWLGLSAFFTVAVAVFLLGFVSTGSALPAFLIAGLFGLALIGVPSQSPSRYLGISVNDLPQSASGSDRDAVIQPAKPLIYSAILLGFVLTYWPAPNYVSSVYGRQDGAFGTYAARSHAVTSKKGIALMKQDSHQRKEWTYWQTAHFYGWLPSKDIIGKLPLRATTFLYAVMEALYKAFPAFFIAFAFGFYHHRKLTNPKASVEQSPFNSQSEPSTRTLLIGGALALIGGIWLIIYIGPDELDITDAPVIHTTPAEAKDYIGYRAVITGDLVQIHTTKSGWTYLNFDKEYPYQTFSAVIPPDASNHLKQTVSDYDIGEPLSNFEVSGIITEIGADGKKHRPHILVTRWDQLSSEEEREGDGGSEGMSSSYGPASY